MNLTDKKALLLDMNGTFMFGEDRFDESQDFSEYYRKIGGMLPPELCNELIREAYAFLECRYPDAAYRHCFPAVADAIRTVDANLDVAENGRLVETFAFHELGSIPDEYGDALRELRQHFELAAVIDIWSPKEAWLREFERAGVLSLFSAFSFSSDHGTVKPSPAPFTQVLRELGRLDREAAVIGDSVRRDLGGALTAGIDCVLVGGAAHPQALACFDDLLAFRDWVRDHAA